MTALAAVATWPARRAAAAVVGPDGVIDAVGPRDEPFAWASVTKLLSSWAVLVALDEGACGLDDPAGPPGATVRHLLAHASGLPFEGSAAIARPGTRRIYSNAGYEVLGAVLERSTGFGFWDYVREGVCEPLGMTGVELRGSPAHGASGTLDDLAAFARDGLAPRLLAPATFAAATSVQFAGLAGVVPGFGRQETCDWGLGPELRDAKHPHWSGTLNSAATFGHFGRSGTFVWIDPAAGLALAGLCDEPFGDWARRAWPELADAVLSDAGVRS